MRGSAGLIFLEGSVTIGDSGRRAGVRQEYEAFFQCLSDASLEKREEAIRQCCKEADADPIASLVYRTVLYVKNGRTASKEFVDAFPTGRKGAQMVWDLQLIAGGGEGSAAPPAAFLPRGPAYKAIDELFVLVLDSREAAAGKYCNLLATASGTGERYMDEQLKILLKESPAIIVKQCVVLRKFQSKLKALLAEMPAAEVRRIRQGLPAFCTPENLDCPEILRLFGQRD